MSNSFYVTLPSNSWTPENDNKLNDYITYLPKPLSLNDNYHVALSEITYTKSWYNVQRVNDFVLYNPRFRIASKSGIKPGWYKTIQDLIYAINSQIESSFTHEGWTVPQFYVNEFSHTVRMECGRDDNRVPVYVNLGEELEDMLGLSMTHQVSAKESITMVNLYDSERLDKDGSLIAGKLYDMKAGIYSLMVYTDIVSHSIVANTQASFLRSARVDDHAEFGANVNLIFEKPYYFPINSSFIDKIRINIKDDSNVPIPFKFGRTCVTLHFKQIWRAII